LVEIVLKISSGLITYSNRQRLGFEHHHSMGRD